MIEMVKASAVIAIFLVCLSGAFYVAQGVANGSFRPTVEITF
jgi:hypothetical protein